MATKPGQIVATVPGQLCDLPYPVTNQELDDLQNPSLLVPQSFENPIPVHAAVDRVVQRLLIGARVSHRRRQAWNRLQLLKPFFNHPRSSFDICLSTFNDLDSFFFGGDLRGRVYVELANEGDNNRWGLTYSAGEKAPRVCIQLNQFYTNRDDHSSVKSLLGLIVHEMVHAYFKVLCPGPRSPDHKPPFQAVLGAIHLVCNVHRFEIPNFDWYMWKFVTPLTDPVQVHDSECDCKCLKGMLGQLPKSSQII